MSVNSISPSHSVQRTQVIKKTEAVAARKQSDIQQSNKVTDRKDAADRQAQIQNQQKTTEPGKPVVNSSGQQTGTRINTAA